MGWVRIDDQFFWHRKVVDLSAQAKLLFIAGLTYAAGQMTDGFLSQGAVKTAAGWLGIRSGVSKELVEVGLWHKMEDGFQIHDYLDYQPSATDERERKLHLTEVRAAAGRKGGIRSGQSRRGKDEATDEAKPKQSQSNGQANREAPRSPEPQLLTTPPTPPPSGTAAVTDLEGGRASLEGQLREALEAMAEAELGEQVERGVVVRSPEAWRRAKVRALEDEHGAEARQLLSEDPGLSSSRLLSVLVNPDYARTYYSGRRRREAEPGF